MGALVLLLGCAPQIPIVYDVESASVDLRALRHEGVAVAPVALVRDLPAPPLPPLPPPGAVEQGLDDPNLPVPTVLDPERDAAFLRNDYIGNVRFGGGYIRTGDVALEVRARLLEFSLQDELALQGAAWLQDAVGDALAEVGVPARPLAAFPAPPPLRQSVRGAHEDDGRDNLNLPRVSLRPGPLTPDAAAPRWVLVPYLRAYYTHNGGWFLGQRYGCLAGARTEVLIVLYDAHAGVSAWSMRALGRHLGHVGQASRAELDQYLLWAEDQVELALREGLFRAP